MHNGPQVCLVPELEVETIKIVEIMKEVEAIQTVPQQALNIPVVSCSCFTVAKKGDFNAPWYVRLAARIVVKHMAKDGVSSYEVCGYKNTNSLDKPMPDYIQAHSSNIYHWILRKCGYSTTVDKVRRHYNCN